jgi:FKBP-type peptidyl-prolyl cis-trans isomerase
VAEPIERRLSSGLDVIEDHAGSGRAAERGDRVTYNVRIFLNRGDEVPLNETQAQHLPQHLLRYEGSRVLVDHTIVLGSREAAAGIERSLLGMRAGGHRKVRIGPHLAYREKGIPGLIPPNAVLTAEIWMGEVMPPSS